MSPKSIHGLARNAEHMRMLFAVVGRPCFGKKKENKKKNIQAKIIRISHASLPIMTGRVVCSFMFHIFHVVNLILE